MFFSSLPWLSRCLWRLRCFGGRDDVDCGIPLCGPRRSYLGVGELMTSGQVLSLFVDVGAELGPVFVALLGWIVGVAAVRLIYRGVGSMFR